MDKILIAASTHWDREWYRTFQEFQIRLCGLMNRLITLLEQDEEFLCYTFDGQSAVLEDYLEIYPENRGSKSWRQRGASYLGLSIIFRMSSYPAGRR